MLYSFLFFFFFAIVVKNLLKELLKTKEPVSLGTIYIEASNRFVFGSIYVNYRFYTFPSFKPTLFMFFEEMLVVIHFRVCRKNVYAISVSFEFVA